MQRTPLQAGDTPLHRAAAEGRVGAISYLARFELRDNSTDHKEATNKVSG
jgi:hypothetical protein